jgi:hypothetical protein
VSTKQSVAAAADDNDAGKSSSSGEAETISQPEFDYEAYADLFNGDGFNFYDILGNGDEEPVRIKEEEEESKEEEDDDEDDVNDGFDGLPPQIYCDLVTTLEDKCAERSILELWEYDEDVIRSLTKEDIIEAINNIKTSPVFGYETDFTTHVGLPTLDASGRVIGGKSIRNYWITKWDTTLKSNSTVQLIGIEYDLADPLTMAWEAKVIDAFRTMKEEVRKEKAGFDILFSMTRRFVPSFCFSLQRQG